MKTEDNFNAHSGTVIPCSFYKKQNKISDHKMNQSENILLPDKKIPTPNMKLNNGEQFFLK